MTSERLAEIRAAMDRVRRSLYCRAAGERGMLVVFIRELCEAVETDNRLLDQLEGATVYPR